MQVWPSSDQCLSPLAARRDGEPGGAGPGGAGVPHALPARVPRVAARPHVPVLAEGPRGETHLRVPAGFPGGLLHLDRAPVPAWREPIDTGLLLAPGTLLSSLRGAEGWLPTEGLCLWSSPGAGQGIGSRCSQGSCWVPPLLIKTCGPCLTKRRCSAGERSLWAPTEPAQESKQSISCQETWVLGDFFTPQLWGEPGGIKGQHHPTSDTWSQSPATPF